MKESTLTFLGTGTSQGIPVPGSDHPVSLSKHKKDKRLRSSVLLEMSGTNMVIDCGPDFRYQMLRENIRSVDAIILTHDHSDHVAGIDDIRPFYFRLDGDMPFFAQDIVLKSIRERYPYIFKEDKYPGVPSIEEIEVKNEDFYFNNIKITPLFLKHGYLDVIAYRINNLVYTTDTNNIPESEYSKLIGVDTLIINALRHKKHHSHFCLSEALEVINRVKPKKAYLTHISQSLGFHREVEKTLPKNVFLAYDGLKIKF